MLDRTMRKASLLVGAVFALGIVCPRVFPPPLSTTEASSAPAVSAPAAPAAETLPVKRSAEADAAPAEQPAPARPEVA